MNMQYLSIQCDLICHVYWKNAEFTLLNLKTSQNIDKFCIFILEKIIEFDEIFGTNFGKLKKKTSKNIDKYCIFIL
jgi:hypothetical protein